MCVLKSLSVHMRVVQFSSSSLWVLGIELRLSGLVATAFTHWAILFLIMFWIQDIFG